MYYQNINLDEVIDRIIFLIFHDLYIKENVIFYSSLSFNLISLLFLYNFAYRDFTSSKVIDEVGISRLLAISSLTFDANNFGSFWSEAFG